MARTPALNADTPILIVDDSTEFSRLLSRLLSGVFGFKSITVLSSTDEAYERVSNNPGEFKLMFLDFHFPSGRNGGELLTAFAESGWVSGKVIFLMSSDPTAEALQRVLKAGAAGIITKPFDREELKRQLERAERLAAEDSEESF